MEVALVVALSALLGVIVGGALQIEASRRALLREHQLDAATKMSVAGTAFFTKASLRSRLAAIDPENATPEEIAAFFDRLRENEAAAREAAAELVEHLARVELVFGEAAETGRKAAEAIGQIHALIEILVGDNDEGAATRFAAEWDRAVDSLGASRRAAHAEFNRPVWRR